MNLTKSPLDTLYNDYEKGDEMSYELYADSLFLMNFVMNLYLMILVDKSLYRTATRGRLLLGAGVGALCYFLPFCFDGPLWVKIPVAICPGSLAMILIAFRVRTLRALVNLFERFFITAVCMGGVMLLLIKTFPDIGAHLTRVWGVLGMGAGCYLLSSHLYNRKLSGNSLCRATLIAKGSKITVRALLDSGNSLVEPISGKPVSVIERSLVTKLWEEEPRIFRVIPYHSIGKQHGILKGYLLPELRVERNGVTKICRDVYIAVCEEYLSLEENEGGSVRMILNPRLFEDEKHLDVS